MASQAELLTAGLDAIDRADWKVAEDLFREAATIGDSPEALDGRATALWWQGRLEEARPLRERAFSAFKACGDLGAAVWLALMVSAQYARVLGNERAARSWAARSHRLIAKAGPCAEAGRILLITAIAGSDWTDAERELRDSLQNFEAGHRNMRVDALVRLAALRIRQGRPDEASLHQ